MAVKILRRVGVLLLLGGIVLAAVATDQKHDARIDAETRTLTSALTGSAYTTSDSTAADGWQAAFIAGCVIAGVGLVIRLSTIGMTSSTAGGGQRGSDTAT